MVENKANSFELISFTSNDVTKSIHHQFSKLNYQIVVRDANEWMEDLTGVHDSVSLIILDNFIPQNLQVVLSKRTRAPCLAIFDCSQSQWDQDIVNSVDDFCGWPCEQQELILRLERLRSKLGENVSKDTINNNEKEWININLIGSCPAFIKLKSLIQKIAQCDVPILIEGETGAGKEVVARAIHYLGNRRDYPFIPVNCGGLPDSLIENELFGHEKGAYTDAKNRQIGLVTQAEGGTLFLDEIESLSPKGQVSLLRFAEDQKYKPLGSTESKKVDIRIIAASNTPLDNQTKQGYFREDLLFRLNVIRLEIPPLRERGSDIEYLANQFLNNFRKKYNQYDKCFHSDAISWLKEYRWPGNVRELENYVEREFIMADGQFIGKPNESKSEHANTNRRKIADRRRNVIYDVPFNEAKKRVIEQFEQCYVTKLLTQNNGSVTMAAELAGKERSAFGKLLKKYGIDKNQCRNRKES